MKIPNLKKCEIPNCGCKNVKFNKALNRTKCVRSNLINFTIYGDKLVTWLKIIIIILDV